MKGFFVECDQCGTIEKRYLPAEPKQFVDKLEGEGWVIFDDNEFCSKDCYQKWYKNTYIKTILLLRNNKP